jgi:hypothetical protein
MPVTKGPVYAPGPLTVRSETTKLSAHGDKLVWTNGRAVVVRTGCLVSTFPVQAQQTADVSRYMTSRWASVSEGGKHPRYRRSSRRPLPDPDISPYNY